MTDAKELLNITAYLLCQLNNTRSLTSMNILIHLQYLMQIRIVYITDYLREEDL
jgi:hypothetical protein